MEIHHGEGGTDSKLFVRNLHDAYVKYGTRQGLRFELLLLDDGHTMAKLVGQNAGRIFSRESGKHTVQRVPPTERGGRWQTSMVSVMVLPIPPVNTQRPLPACELEEKFQTGKQGAGGQNVNKVASAVRLLHKPTGLSVFINGRDQGSNRKEALRLLTARVNDLRNNACNEAYCENRREQWGGGGRGDKIRTYNFIKHRAVDHRSGVKTGNVDAVIGKGQFELLLPTEKPNGL